MLQLSLDIKINIKNTYNIILMEDNSPLRSWFFSTNKIVKDSNIRNVTHYMLDGGKLDLTNDYVLFQELYEKYFNYKNCIVEKKTNTFRFFIDFDVLSKELINISEYTKCIQNVMSNIYKDSNLRCIITKADSDKEIMKEGNMYLKQGYHFNWPNVLVDKSVAIRIRDTILIAVTTMFGKPGEFYDSWDKILDKCVYEKNGLRLIGSDKCTHSDGISHYENRVYKFMTCYVGNKVSEKFTDFYKTNLLSVIKDTSIRSDAENNTIYYDLPEYEETSEDVDLDKNDGFIVMSRESPERIQIEKFFKNHVTGYRVEDIRAVLKSKTSDILYLINTKSKFCQNKCGFHTNNHIYFKLSPVGICQKCMSENDGEANENGTVINCKKFESKCIKVTPDLKSALKWGVKKSNDPVDKTKDRLSLMMQTLSEELSNKKEISGPYKTKKSKKSGK